MTGYRDMRAARWARTLKRLRKAAEDLREHGWPICPEPADFATPPHQRIANVSTDM